MKLFRAILKYWLPLAVVVTLVAGFVYVVNQQIYRANANDPQIQMSEDAALALANQQPLESLVPAGKVDIAQSLAPFIIIYDSNGQPVASNAMLHGSIPEVPSGIFEYTRQNGQDRVTFQPESGVRSATVITAVDGGKGGFVLAGRSLREVEKRVDLLGLHVGIGWAVTLAATLALVILLELLPFTR
jgi:hypothetical protein